MPLQLLTRILKGIWFLGYRPEGPILNSHDRQVVGTSAEKKKRPGGPPVVRHRIAKSTIGPSGLAHPARFADHDLPIVAIEYGPFGPIDGLATRTPDANYYRPVICSNCSG